MTLGCRDPTTRREGPNSVAVVTGSIWVIPSGGQSSSQYVPCKNLNVFV